MLRGASGDGLLSVVLFIVFPILYPILLPVDLPVVLPILYPILLAVVLPIRSSPCPSCLGVRGRQGECVWSRDG